MEQTVNTIKNYFKKKQNIESPAPAAGVPQIGFRVSYSEVAQELKIKVIGARQLPTDFGSIKPRGYLVKVTFYPQKEKFETKTVRENWPTINEEFTCRLILPVKRNDDYLKGKFISFTIYAVFGKEEDQEKPKEKPRGVLKRYFSFNDTDDSFLRNNSFKRAGSTRRSSYATPTNNRRTIGAVTYNLDRKLFTQKLRNDFVGTPDIWRNVTEITSGIQTKPRDGAKGSIELTLQYGVSEDGKNDVVEVSITKFRCSIQTMQQYEKVGGQLYIKITAFECDDLIQKMKSDKFDPTISLKLEANTSTLRATVNKYNMEEVKILIRLISKNILGKKCRLAELKLTVRVIFGKRSLLPHR